MRDLWQVSRPCIKCKGYVRNGNSFLAGFVFRLHRIFRGSVDKVNVTNVDTWTMAEALLIAWVRPKSHVRFSRAEDVPLIGTQYAGVWRLYLDCGLSFAHLTSTQTLLVGPRRVIVKLFWFIKSQIGGKPCTLSQACKYENSGVVIVGGTGRCVHFASTKGFENWIQCASP